MLSFATEAIESWTGFQSFVRNKNWKWIFRGQPEDHDPSSTLERTLAKWKIGLQEASKIEHQLIREFRRRLLDPLHARIHDDTLHCMSLMRHHGAPVRLLDCSYSAFVAAKFAIEKGAQDAIIYCFNVSWCEKNAKQLFGDGPISNRGSDERRKDHSFDQLYLSKTPKKFVLPENPLHLNERLSIQQGIFLCPGDVGAEFASNIEAMDGWNDQKNLVKVELKLEPKEIAKFASNLKRMNLSSTVLFPGLDGFCKSLGEEILHFKRLADAGAGA